MASGDSKTQEGEQRNEKEGNEINKVTRPGRYSMINNKPKNSTGRPATKFVCTGCGNQAHPLGGHCPTRGKYCFRCQKSHHFSRLHPSRKPKQYWCASESSRGCIGLDPSKNYPASWRSLVQGNQGKSQNPTATLQLNTVPVTLHMQADVTVITEKQFESLKGTSHLHPTKVVMRRYSGDGIGPELPLISCFIA